MSRYIDADKLKNELDKMCREYTQEKSTFHPHIDFVFETINRQPTADVRENITAHKVIGGGEHDGATCWFECSRCGQTVDVDDVFCKHCGAEFVD